MLQLMQIELPILTRQKSISLRRFLLLATLSFSFLFSATARSQELTVQADRWCPYNCEPGTATPGYVIELLQAIFEPKGIKIRYEVVPWDRTLIQARDGKADVALAATQHEADTFGLLIGSESIGDSSDCLYVGPNNKIKFSSAGDLNSLKRIGVSSGYSYSTEIDAWLKRPENRSKIIVQKGEEPAEINARNLALGRLDGVIEDDHVMQQLIFKFGLEHDLVLAGCQKQTKIYAAFSPKLKNAQYLVKEFDEGMETLRQNGQLAKILAKYGLTDWK
jgi:polar amino acid transport system substrate-binding protein